MDVHGVIVAMRIAIVGVVALVVIPLAWGTCVALCKRIDRKAALRTSTANTQSSSAAQHRKVS